MFNADLDFSVEIINDNRRTSDKQTAVINELN